MSRPLIALLAVAFLSSMLPAQLTPGQIVHGYGGNAVALIDVAGQTQVRLSLAPGNLAANAFVWNRAAPNELISWASDSHLYRVAVGPMGATTYQRLGTRQYSGVEGVTQLSWDQGGQLLVVGNSPGGQVFRVDPVTGADTLVLDFPFPQSIRCGEADPLTGDIWLGSRNALWRVTGTRTGTPSVTQILTTAGNVDSLAFDPSNPRTIIYCEQGNIWRIDTQTLVPEQLEFLSNPFFSFVRRDGLGRFIASAGRNVYEIPIPGLVPSGGITPMLIGRNTNIGCCLNVDLAVVGDDARPFSLFVDNPPGGGATISYRNVPSGVGQTWLLPTTDTRFPVNQGPLFGIYPDLLTLTFIQLFPTPVPGSPVHSAGPPPAVFSLPPGTFTPFVGQSWDLVNVAFDTSGTWLGRTNVARVTWR